MRLPDRFQEHDKPEKQYAEAGLDAAGIVDTVLKALRVKAPGIEECGRSKLRADQLLVAAVARSRTRRRL
jgi:hypothetical protein